MELAPGYKATELGTLPEDWDLRTIGQVFRLINGCAFKPKDWSDRGTPIIRIQNLNDPDSRFNYYSRPVDPKYRVLPGDLLFAWSGTTGTSFGARIWAGPPGVLNQHIFKVLTDERELLPAFSLVVLQQIQQEIEKRAHGFKSSFVHVKKSDLVGVLLPVPPIAEQRAIAQALLDAEALAVALTHLIAKKRDLKQAAMQQLLTGQTRLPGYSGQWEQVRLGSLGRCQRGVSYKPEVDLSPHDTDQTVRLFRSNNVQNAEVLTNDVQFVNRRRVSGQQVMRQRDTLIWVRIYLTHQQIPHKLSAWSAKTALPTPCSAQSLTLPTWKPASRLLRLCGGRTALSARAAMQRASATA